MWAKEFGGPRESFANATLFSFPIEPPGQSDLFHRSQTGTSWPTSGTQKCFICSEPNWNVPPRALQSPGISVVISPDISCLFLFPSCLNPSS